MNNAENPFEGKERLIYKWGMVLIISAFAISLTSFWFFNTFLQSNLVPSSQGNNLFFIFRLILIFFYPLAFLPGSFVIELTDSRVNGRPYRLKNVLAIALFLGELVLIVTALVTVFDVLLPSASVFVQGPLAAVSMSLSIYAVVTTSKVAKARGYLSKAF